MLSNIEVFHLFTTYQSKSHFSLILVLVTILLLHLFYLVLLGCGHLLPWLLFLFLVKFVLPRFLFFFFSSFLSLVVASMLFKLLLDVGMSSFQHIDLLAVWTNCTTAQDTLTQDTNSRLRHGAILRHCKTTQLTLCVVHLRSVFQMLLSSIYDLSNLYNVNISHILGFV